MAKAEGDEGRLNVRLTREFLRRLKVECAKRGVTMQAATEEALTAWLRRGGSR